MLFAIMDSNISAYALIVEPFIDPTDSEPDSVQSNIYDVTARKLIDH